MKLFKFIIIICLMLISCNRYSYRLESTPVSLFNKHQIDSLCNIYNIPNITPAVWIYSSFNDHLSDKIINQYIYIKKENDVVMTFICTHVDSVYRFNFKTARKIKK